MNLTSGSQMSGILLDSYEPLFASPLFRFVLPDAAPLNRLLLVEAKGMRAGDTGVRRSNRNAWHSRDDLFQQTGVGSVALRGQIVEAIRLATLSVSPDFEFSQWQLQMEGWINISGRGGFNAPHDHPAFAWSGVYYVTVPPPSKADSGAIEFLDPRTNTRVPTVQGAQCFLDTRKLQPQAGLMLLFPSYLRHWVYPNEEDAERVSIAFNARFIQKNTG